MPPSEGSLEAILRKRGTLTTGEALRVCAVVAAQLRDLSRQGKQCGALRAGDVMISETGDVALQPDLAKERRVGSHGDVYALGNLLFQLLTGRADETPDVSRLSGIDSTVAKLCARFLSVDPNVRPSMDEAEAMLKRLVGDSGSSLPRIESPGTLGGRTGFMAAVQRTAFMGAVRRESSALKAARLIMILAVLAATIALFWVALP